MRKSVIAIALTALCMAFTGCREVPAEAVRPLMGIDWFTSYEEVKRAMEDYTLLDEREKTGIVPQKMQDYTGVDLFDHPCDLTLCFTDSGLIGFNYHDIERHQGYKDWYSTLEATYGLPTEEGSGMASWYDNPAGKDTVIYLFNLEEGIQVSIYATADSPDKSYDRTVDAAIPTPEIRTPIVPVTNEPPASNAETAETAAPAQLRVGDVAAETAGDAMTDAAGAPIRVDTVVTDPAGNIMTDDAGNGMTDAEEGTAQSGNSAASTSSTTTTAVADETTTEHEEAPVDQTNAFLLNGLQFYGSPDTERRKMSAYTQLYEYRTEEPGQPWELIMEYENVPYLGKPCDGVLCFTSLGLVGINYFDPNTSDYNFWVQSLTALYGTPDETQYDYTAWSSAPVGSGTKIYAFALEDGVQISFFADDTGSELP